MTDEKIPDTSAPSDITPPKKRGRPSNADLASRLGKSPDTPKSVDDAKPMPGKRGPKPGRRKKGMSDEDKGTLAKQVMGLHQIASMATGVPELAISEPEAALLASAIANVSVEYGLSMSGKTGALLQLLGVAAMVYLPRLGAVKQRAIAKKATKNTLHAVDAHHDPVDA